MTGIEYKSGYFSIEYLKKVLGQDKISKKAVSKLHSCDLTRKQKLCVEAILQGKNIFLESKEKEENKDA